MNVKIIKVCLHQPNCDEHDGLIVFSWCNLHLFVCFFESQIFCHLNKEISNFFITAIHNKQLQWIISPDKKNQKTFSLKHVISLRHGTQPIPIRSRLSNHTFRSNHSGNLIEKNGRQHKPAKEESDRVKGYPTPWSDKKRNILDLRTKCEFIKSPRFSLLVSWNSPLKFTTLTRGEENNEAQHAKLALFDNSVPLRVYQVRLRVIIQVSQREKVICSILTFLLNPSSNLHVNGTLHHLKWKVN